MPRLTPPSVISGVLTGSSLWSAAVLLSDPDPFAIGAAALISIGVLGYTLIAVAGILLVRAPWARWLGLSTTIGVLLITAITGFDSAWAYLAIAVSLAAVAGLSGPWLKVWLRQRPGTGPEPKAVALPLIATGAPLVAGLAAWPGLTALVIAAAMLGPVAAWGYGRAWRWGLWALRIAYPVMAVAAGAQVGWPGGLLLGGHGVVVSVLAWSAEASRAQLPIGTTLPAPRPQRQRRSP